MKVLWAPWRMEYILGDQKGGACIFCPGEDRAEDSLRGILHVGKTCMAMMNRFPYTNGHLLVAPVRHVHRLDALTEAEGLDLMKTVTQCVAVLRRTMHPDGFNVGLNLGKVAGAGVEDHLHFHIVPRWNGDNNFMTVLGDVRVIPQHIEETYRTLLPHFQPPLFVSGGEA